MPQRQGRRRAAMYNTPQIRNGGFGALQVEAITNRPLSIARRHLAASQLRMRDIEPDELSSSEWVRFLVMEGAERDRFISDFARRRRDSSGSSSSSSSNDDYTYSFSQDRQTQYDKAEEARLEAEEARREGMSVPMPVAPTPTPAFPARGSTPLVSMWARHLDELEQNERTDNEPSTYNAMRPMHARRGVDENDVPPPAYHSVVRPGTPPPAYAPRSDDEGDGSERPNRLRRWSNNILLTRLSPGRE
ncbi:hypothetical protein DOTSEDRAFT_70755 [Dothistroma septosporum NZE10]|uniref:Uncharacterized protein n=1 Tax=Dothistroma septosporum (strain NZE10 / CBS 128990) TaxID=675120 RepID=N1PWX4_DOTSN|nr:hypothetical protein DOTSEDRAFT_70755 [Dothistroma septosporum NZE10]